MKSVLPITGKFQPPDAIDEKQTERHYSFQSITDLHLYIDK